MKTKIRLSQLLVIGCFFGFFLFCLVWGLAQPDRPASAAANRSLTASSLCPSRRSVRQRPSASASVTAPTCVR